MQAGPDALRFRVLGPIEVSLGGEPLLLRAPLQRKLLAALLAGSGRVVSVDALTDALWKDLPSDQARKALLVCLHRLRRALREPERITLEPDGYRIRVAAYECDAAAFDDLASAARRERGAGRFERAAVLYERAVQLWRGGAYADVSEIGLISAEADRLDEGRLLARQELLETRLDLGRPDSVIGDLEALARDHPFRERLIALRMLALHRAGRQAEALQVYRESRRTLGEELGIEPGRLLQRVHEAVLRGDERLATVATASLDGAWVPLAELRIEPAAPAPAVPRELPADVIGFTGRDGELRDLEAARLGEEDEGIPPSPVVVISGMAGVGKTASAVHWAHRIASDYPDGQLFLNLRGYSAVPELQPIEALTAMLRSLGLDSDQVPPEADQAAARFRTETAGKRLLLLLDNAASAEQVAPLLPGGPGSLVIVTSRNQLGDLLARHGGFLLDQAPLAPDEALELLRSVLRVPRSAPRSAMVELARRCGYLPLALRIAAANLVDQPRLGISGFTQRLSSGSQLAALRIGDSPAAAMRATFDGSYTALRDDARGVFRLLGIAPVRSLPVDAVAVLADASPAVTERAVEQLVNVHMVNRVEHGRLNLHDLIREYANDLVDEADPARTGALERLFEWYVDMADAACRVLYRGAARLLDPDRPLSVPHMDDAERARRWLDEERDNLIAVARHAGDHGHGSRAWMLADILRLHTWSQGDSVGLLAHGEAALSGARADGSLPGEAVAELVLSAAYHSARRYAEVVAHAERAIMLSRRIGWEAGEASARHTATLACWQIGRLRDALEHSEAALAVNRAKGRLRAQCVNLGALGVVHGFLGALREELRLHTEALGLAEEIGDSGLQSVELHCLAQTSIDLGLLRAAEEFEARAMKIDADRGAGELSAAAAETMAALCASLGEYDSALSYAEAFVRHGETRGDRKWTADGLISVAVALNRLGRHAEAESAATRALDVGGGLAEILINGLIERAAARIGLGEFASAGADARRALERARECGYRLREGKALNLMAELRLHEGEAGGARELASQALDDHRSSGYRAGAAWSLWILGRAAQREGDDVAARRYRREVEEIYAAMGAPVPARFPTGTG